MIKEIVKKNRSYRRFFQEKEIKEEELIDCIDTARYTASGANKQQLRYIISSKCDMNEKIYDCLRWAGYYSDWDGPKEGERPAAYIILVGPTVSNTSYDEGIVAQTILLAATEKGFGGCMLGNVDRVKMKEIVAIPQDYSIKLVIALGYPKEEVVIDDISSGQDIVYYRDDKQRQHVPKIKTSDLILENDV